MSVLKFTPKQKEIILWEFFMLFTPEQLNEFCKHRENYNVIKVHWTKQPNYYNDPKVFLSAKPSCSDYFFVILKEQRNRNDNDKQFDALLKRSANQRGKTYILLMRFDVAKKKNCFYSN